MSNNFIDLEFVSVHESAKKELGQYKAILTSRLVKNAYLLYGYSSTRALIGCFLVMPRKLLARCPGHIQSVFNLIVDILMDIHVMVN